jgi:putative membrane protein
MLTLVAQLPTTTSEVLAFHLHLDVLGVIAGLAVGYEIALRRLAAAHVSPEDPVVTRRQRAAFYSGIGLLTLVSSWPLHDIGEGSLYFVHMIEHMVFAFFAPPLLLYGVPRWLLRVVVDPVMGALRVLTRPVVALVVFNALIAIIHVPEVVGYMLRSSTGHAALHVATLLVGTLMWWPVVGPLPGLGRLSPFGRMGYLFLQSLVPTIPAAFLTLGETPLYPIYESLPRLGGISALADQQIAGLIMKLGVGLWLWGFITGYFFSWYAADRRTDTPRPLSSTRS